MAQGDFTREEAKATRDAIDEMFRALSKPKQREFLGHLNDVLLFIRAAEQTMPAAPSTGEPQ